MLSLVKRTGELIAIELSYEHRHMSNRVMSRFSQKTAELPSVSGSSAVVIREGCLAPGYDSHQNLTPMVAIMLWRSRFTGMGAIDFELSNVPSGCTIL